MKQLTGYDLIALRLIELTPGVSVRGLHTAINAWIKMSGVTSDYATPKKDKSSVEVTLRKLREAGLLSTASMLAVNQANALKLWQTIGRDWRRWPWYIPLTNEGLDYAGIKERTK